MNILDTQRTRPRSLTAADLDALADLYADSQTMTFITGGVPRSHEETLVKLYAIERG